MWNGERFLVRQTYTDLYDMLEEKVRLEEERFSGSKDSKRKSKLF